MSARATGLAVALWAVLAVLLVSIAFNARHFSSWEFLIPTAEPLSWIIPTLLAGPPLLLALARRTRPGLSTPIACSLAIVLGGVIAAIIVLFSPTAYLGT